MSSFSDRSRSLLEIGASDGVGAVPVWDDVPIYAGRDLARADLWRVSQGLSLSKRRFARQPPSLPRARKASVSLVLAAVAAATPALSFAHSRTASKPTAATVDRDKRGTLEFGDRGRAVERLQRVLGIAVDGVFGPQTRKAVKAFQREAGLEVDGVVGAQTRAALGLGTRTIASVGGGVLELGDRGRAVKALQQALGVGADGVFGPVTLKAVKAFQQRAGLVVDGIVGPQTRAALAGGAVAHAHTTSGTAGESKSNGNGTADAAVPAGIDTRLAAAYTLGREMGLKLISGYRPGATIAASGNRSDHSFNPSRAIDMAGTKAQMRRYAKALAGTRGVETIIYSGVGLWISGHGWREIGSSVTYRDHLDHVHVDTF